MQDTFNVSHDSLAALAPAAMLGGLLAAFLSGSIIGRFSIGPVLVVGMAFAGVGLLGYAVAPAWIVLLGVAFVASIGKGTMDAGLNNFASANYGASEMNWLHACWGIGLTIAPAVVTHFVLYQGGGWQSSYIVVGLAILLIGLVILLSLPLWQIKTRSSKSKAGLERPPMSESLRRPIVLIGLVFFFLYGGVEIGTGTAGQHPVDRSARLATRNRKLLGQRILGQFYRRTNTYGAASHAHGRQDPFEYLLWLHRGWRSIAFPQPKQCVQLPWNARDGVRSGGGIPDFDSANEQAGRARACR